MPKEDEAMEDLARDIIQASSSQERMQYLVDKGTALYSAKDSKDRILPPRLTAVSRGRRTGTRRRSLDICRKKIMSERR